MEQDVVALDATPIINEPSGCHNKPDCNNAADESLQSTSSGSSSTRDLTSPANLGHFEDGGNADKSYVLVIHDDYKDTDNEREGDEADVERLERTFKTKRNCNFQTLKSPTINEIMEILSSEETFLRIFGGRAPSVLMIYILSHGNDRGIGTKHNGDVYKLSKVIRKLKLMEALKSTLIIAFPVTCRGAVRELVHSPNQGQEENTLRARFMLSELLTEQNLVLLYPTVEGSLSNRNPRHGTWLVEKICQVFDELYEDTPLEVVLTKIQREIHMKSLKYTKNAKKKSFKEAAQTAEVKFLPHQKFWIKSVSHQPHLARERQESDDLGKRGYFSWVSEKNTPVRKRKAAIFSLYGRSDDAICKVEKVLRSKLKFDTEIMRLSTQHLEIFLKSASGHQNDYGCILMCFFANLCWKTEPERGKELCVRLDNGTTTVERIVQRFLGPKNDRWIGRPKIFFFVDQQEIHLDHITMPEQFEMEATNSSGYFIHILPHKDYSARLVGILEGLEDDCKNLQELAVESLNNSTKVGEHNLQPQILSTLQYLLSFPKWPSLFISQTLQVSLGHLNPAKMTFKEVEEECIQDYETDVEHYVSILLAPAGAGKSTMLNELAHNLSVRQEKMILFADLKEQQDLLSYNRPKEWHVVSQLIFKYAKGVMGLNETEREHHLKTRNFILLIDGFSEINSRDRKRALKILEFIVKLKLPLWVAIRPEEEKCIKKHLKKMECPWKIIKINPLEREQQLELMQQTTNKTNSECETMLKNFESTILSAFLSNPFHLIMISEQASNGKNSTLFDVYNKMVKEMVKLSIDEYEPEDLASSSQESDNMIPTESDHLRILYIHAENVLLKNKKEGISETDITCANKTKLTSGPKAEFVHQNFSNFCVAKKFIAWLSSMDKDLGSSNAEIFTKENLSLCRWFVNEYFSKPVKEKRKKKFSTFFRKEKLHVTALQIIVNEGLLNIFNLIHKYVKKGAVNCNLLLSACEVDQNLAVKLAKKAVLADFEDSDLIRLINKVAEKDFGSLFRQLTAKSNAGTFLKRLKGLKDPKLLPISYAAKSGHLEMLKDLLKCEFDVAATNTKGENALHEASSFGQVRCAEIILKNGLSVDKPSKFGTTALMKAAQTGNREMVIFLLKKGANPAEKNRSGKTALHIAAEMGNFETFEHLFHLLPEFKQEKSAYRAAAMNKDMRICDYIFANMPSVDKDTENEFANEAILAAVESNNIDVFKKLICRFEIDLVADSELKSKLLCKSIKSSAIDVTDHLISKNVNLDEIVNDKGSAICTALFMAARHANFKMCEFLVDKVVNKTYVDQNGNNCLHAVCARYQYAKKTIIARFDRFINLKFLKTLVPQELVNAHNNKFQTPMHIAAEYGTKRLVKLLLELGADTKAVNSEHLNPVQVAERNSQKAVYHFLLVKTGQKDHLNEDQSNASANENQANGDQEMVIDLSTKKRERTEDNEEHEQSKRSKIDGDTNGQ